MSGLSTFSGLASPWALSSGQSVDLAASGREEHGDDPSAEKDAAPPPLGVKLTIFRLLIVTILLSIGIIKAVLAYKGRSIAPTALELVSGGVVGVVLYWIGLYEERHAKIWQWFFQVDLAPAINYFTKRFIGGVGAPLFFDGSPAPGLWLGSLLTTLARCLVAPFPSARRVFYSQVPLVWISQTVVFSALTMFLWFCACAPIRRVLARVWAWERAMRFLDDYGPRAPLANRYWWFGAIGTVAGIFCGIVLAYLPVIIIYVYF